MPKPTAYLLKPTGALQTASMAAAVLTLAGCFDVSAHWLERAIRSRKLAEFPGLANRYRHDGAGRRSGGWQRGVLRRGTCIRRAVNGQCGLLRRRFVHAALDCAQSFRLLGLAYLYGRRAPGREEGMPRVWISVLRKLVCDEVAARLLKMRQERGEDTEPLRTAAHRGWKVPAD
jgi:hypothetical protein